MNCQQKTIGISNEIARKHIAIHGCHSVYGTTEKPTARIHLKGLLGNVCFIQYFQK